LPRRYRLAQQWNLLYSLDQHGSSLSTLYTMLQDAKGPCLLVLKDEDSHLFGAYLNEPLHVSSSFYGTGECFLWKLTDAVVPDASHHPPPKIKVFPWTGKNEYMIVSEPSFVAFGGGDGKFGLWLNSDLERGHSEPCPTFDNEALSPHPQFSCIELEIWGFQI
ncbi:TLDc domain-containing protein, partial [Radiomyces spectabilis]|uniref:TLDc domain-containing protein n=1 Tax=Radiomyces spectabilis TaxID=64574 RepID=UPI00221FD010